MRQFTFDAIGEALRLGAPVFYDTFMTELNDVLLENTKLKETNKKLLEENSKLKPKKEPDKEVPKK